MQNQVAPEGVSLSRVRIKHITGTTYHEKHLDVFPSGHVLKCEVISFKSFSDGVICIHLEYICVLVLREGEIQATPGGVNLL